MEYTVILHPAEEGGYWGEVPALPGCFSQGETVEDTLSNVKEAIESHLIALKAEGRQAPKASPLIRSDPFVLVWNDPWDAQLISWQFGYRGVLKVTRGGRHEGYEERGGQ